MMKHCRRHSIHKPRPLTLPELDQSKNSVLNNPFVLAFTLLLRARDG